MTVPEKRCELCGMHTPPVPYYRPTGMSQLCPRCAMEAWLLLTAMDRETADNILDMIRQVRRYAKSEYGLTV